MLFFFLIVWYEFMYIRWEIVFSYVLLLLFQDPDVLDYYEFNDDNELLQRLLNSNIQVYK